MRVVLPQDEKMAPLVARLLADIYQGRFSEHATLAEAAEQPGQIRILLPLLHPIEALARSLGEMDSSAQALTAWKDDATQLLTKARRIRRCLVLVDARALLSCDSDVLALIGARTKDADQSTSAAPVLAPPALLVLAAALLDHDAEASALVNEINALRHGLSAGPLTDEQLEKAHRSYLHLTAENQDLRRANEELKADDPRIAQLNQEQDRLAEENALLRESIEHHLKREEFSAALVSKTTEDVEKKESEILGLRQIEGQGQEAQGRIKALEEERRQLLEKNDLLSKQNMNQAAAQENLISTNVTLASELKSANASLGELKKIQVDQDAKNKEIAKLRKNNAVWAEEGALLRESVALSLTELEKLTNEREYLVTERDSLRQASVDREMIKDEAEALRRRINTVTRKSELRETVLSMTLLQDQKDIHDSRARIGAHQDKIQKLKSEINVLSDEISYLKSELDRIYGSKSWRVTKPLRGVRSLTVRRKDS